LEGAAARRSFGAEDGMLLIHPSRSPSAWPGRSGPSVGNEDEVVMSVGDWSVGLCEPGQASEYASATPYIAHHLLPSPSASRPLKQPDARFMDSEAFTDKFASHVSGTMEKVNRRTVKRWGDRAQGASELGALLNGFSLENKASLQTAVEKFGQAVDAEQLTTALLVLRVHVERLGHAAFPLLQLGEGRGGLWHQLPPNTSSSRKRSSTSGTSSMRSNRPNARHAGSRKRSSMVDAG
jgi:hypothetical protein